jgi:hypothetical protein
MEMGEGGSDGGSPGVRLAVLPEHPLAVPPGCDHVPSARAAALAGGGGLGLQAGWQTGGCKTGHGDGVHLSTGGGVTVTCVALQGHSASAAAGLWDVRWTQGQHQLQAGAPDRRDAHCTPCRQTPCPARTRWEALEPPAPSAKRTPRRVSRLVSAAMAPRASGALVNLCSAGLDREIADFSRFLVAFRVRKHPSRI